MSALGFHIVFMSSAFAAMASAVSIARFGRKRKWWLAAHRALNISSVVLLCAGFASAAIMLGGFGTSASGAPHRIAGGLGILLALAMALLGASFAKKGLPGSPAARRALHRWGGRAALVLLPVALALGLRLIGLF